MAIEDDEIRDLWPGGLPEAEEALWLRLPASRKRKAVARLRAVLGLNPPSGAAPVHMSMADAAAAAETGVSTFYAIARRWRRHPSLAALGVHATSDGPGIRMEEDARSALEKRIAAILAADPDLSIGEVRSLVAADMPGDPAFATVRRTVQKLLREMPPRGPFGERIVFDSAGLDMSSEAGTEPAVMRLNAVLDGGTGLVLGWDIEPETEVADSYARAVRRAWPRNHRETEVARRRGHGLNEFNLTGARASKSPPTFHVNLIPGTRTALRLPEGSRSFENPTIGASLVAALGERLGPVWIGKGIKEPGRSFRTGRIEAMPSFGSGIERLVDDAISRHNLARLALIPRDAPIDEAPLLAAEIGRRAAALFS